ncbi:MAG: hypothetical protein AB8H80_09155 [Planctomycetota bacterium]
MSENEGDKTPESQPPEEAVTTAPEAATDAASTAAAADAAAESTADDSKLTDLMSAPPADAGSPAGTAPVDLEAEALRAAEQALVDGEKALAAARDQLQATPTEGASTPHNVAAGKSAGSRGREVALRLLLGVNVLAMLVVVMLPAPDAVDDPVVEAPPPVREPVETAKPVAKRMNEPWNRALRASERREWDSAVSILEGYLADNQRMPPGERLSVLSTLSYYASRANDAAKSQSYAQQAQSLEQSHSLPEDLVSSAQAAYDSGNQESLRRIWARFLLQQRQIPSWLYQHVARAYLQLGDSYRQEADAAAELVRKQELTDAAAKLRAQARSGAPK